MKTHLYSQQEEFVDKVKKQIQLYLTGIDPVIQSKLDYLTLSEGKLFRPNLIFLTSKIAEVNLKQAIEISAACELIHLASLVHDDIIDNASNRRGIPTLNFKFGNKASVLIGDFLFSKAFLILAPHVDQGAFTPFLNAIDCMCRGELKQLENVYNPDLSLLSYLDIIELKTASLIAACTEACAHMAGLPSTQVENLKKFGLHMGKTYQIVDDIMDYIGVFSEKSKTRGNDIREGIVTLPLIYFFSEPQFQEFRSEIIHLWESPISQEQVKTLTNRLIESGSIEKAIGKAKEESMAATSYIKDFPESEAKTHLVELLNKITTKIPENLMHPAGVK